MKNQIRFKFETDDYHVRYFIEENYVHFIASGKKVKDFYLFASIIIAHICDEWQLSKDKYSWIFYSLNGCIYHFNEPGFIPVMARESFLHAPFVEMCSDRYRNEHGNSIVNDIDDQEFSVLMYLRQRLALVNSPAYCGETIESIMEHTKIPYENTVFILGKLTGLRLTGLHIDDLGEWHFNLSYAARRQLSV
ncbi:hypothetical protein ABGV42_01575 [Paenibacillus pabuli]|uniref:hypothetical protein n=1 Tax=Paenibacillus pabuli TaxID=1472 RepID=UPI0032426267